MKHLEEENFMLFARSSCTQHCIKTVAARVSEILALPYLWYQEAQQNP
jgi:hypothetical protein